MAKKGVYEIAIYHCSIKIISRGKGRSAVAAAAYRSGERLVNSYDGVTHDYTRKRGIIYSEILLPDNAPASFADRSTLWNAVEAVEKYSTAQLAREIEIALPVELDRERQIQLVRNYCRTTFVSAGMCADYAIHDKGDGNPHAHIMLTMRSLKNSGEWEAKSYEEPVLDENGQRIRLKNGKYKTRKVNIVDWNDKGKAEEWRAGWAAAVNRAFESAEIAQRIDHRSYKRQGIKQIPTAHLGVSATQMERRGVSTDRGNWNRQIVSDNKLLYGTRRRLSRLNEWLSKAVSIDEKERMTADFVSSESNLIQILTDRLVPGQEKTKWKKVNDLKEVAKIIAYLQSNNIQTLSELHERAAALTKNYNVSVQAIKKTEKRMNILMEQIKQAETHLRFQPVFLQYQQIKPQEQQAFYDLHRMELTLFEAANKYLQAQNIVAGTAQVKAWKAESEKLFTEQEKRYTEMRQHRDEVKQMESIQRNVDTVKAPIDDEKETHR